MKYYKVKPQYDGKSKRSRGYEDDVYIANELYTEREVQRQNLNRTFLEEKEIYPKNVYWFFGARFENGTSYSDRQGK